MNDDNQSKQPLSWAPHELPIYDEVLKAACANEIRRLAVASSQERLEFIIDPREVHKRLYAALTPEEHPEYAGTYRGTPGTTLEARVSGARREDNGSFQAFLPPNRVSEWMEKVADQAKKIFSLPPETSPGAVLSEIVRLFYIFGMTHPFLDGNGHIQRLIFAACVMERKPLRLRESWTIHPRPYDIEMKSAFEVTEANARHAALCKILAAYLSG